MLMSSASLVASCVLIPTIAVAASPCTTAKPDPEPGRLTSITWDWAYAHLLLVDAAAGEVRTYSTAGTLVERWANPGPGLYEFAQPLFLVRTETGFVLQDGGYHFIELDRDLKPTASHDLEGDESAEKGTRGGSVHWAGTGDGIVGYGSLQRPGQEWTTGLLKVTWSPIVRFQILHEFPSDPASQQLYHMGVATTAACAGRYYQLGFGESYGVFEVSGSDARLRRGLPSAFGSLPQLPPSQGRANSRERLHALAGSSGVAHLYSDGASLFVVLRDARSGTRRWLLARYDPGAERVTGVWLLPSGAIDVLLALGPSRSALVEVAGWRADGTMSVGNLIVFPSEPLQKAAGSLDAPAPVCE